MKNRNGLLAFSVAIAALAFSMSACTKDSPDIVREMVIELPQRTVLAYGNATEIALPATLSNRSDVTLSLAFNKTTNVALGPGKMLHDILKEAIKLDLQKQHIAINASLLYPNSAPSVTSENKIPETYTATLLAKAIHGATVGEQDFQINVSPGEIAIENVNTSNNMPFSYALYSDKMVEFKLDALTTPVSNSTWYVEPQADQKQIFSVIGSTIRFSADAGDPAKKAEHTYDLKPMLIKDGFVVAETKFRVVFIPQIKFFFGMYYPDMNLTILLNLLHIGLSNGYLSSPPTLYPENYRSSFSLVSVSLDGKVFDNSAAVFSVNQSTGSVSVKKDETLKAGSYKIQVKAITTTGLEYQTDLTLVMSSAS